MEIISVVLRLCLVNWKSLKYFNIRILHFRTSNLSIKYRVSFVLPRCYCVPARTFLGIPTRSESQASNDEGRWTVWNDYISRLSLRFKNERITVYINKKFWNLPLFMIFYHWGKRNFHYSNQKKGWFVCTNYRKTDFFMGM